MGCPLLLVTGTGTGIGKTVIACGLTAAWARNGRKIAGLKPIESGVTRGELGSDIQELGQVSTFHVTRFTPPYLLMDPVSPHLAARREGRSVDPQVVLDWLAPIREAAEGIVLELPGGLFTPLGDNLSNADLVLELAPTKVVLVAPDRLGVLHDVLATTRAARAQRIRIDGLFLSSPLEPDASTGTNAAELARVAPELDVLATLPRASANVHAPLLDTALRTLSL
jgi:dethiobiotin synthetase